MSTEQKTNTAENGGSALNVQLCGCGRPIRYMMPGGGSCNKYTRCLTYEEMHDALKKEKILVRAYQDKRAVDGLNGRKWDASKHFEAEAKIEALEKAHNAELRCASRDSGEASP